MLKWFSKKPALYWVCVGVGALSWAGLTTSNLPPANSQPEYLGREITALLLGFVLISIAWFGLQKVGLMKNKLTKDEE